MTVRKISISIDVFTEVVGACVLRMRQAGIAIQYITMYREIGTAYWPFERIVQA